MIQVNKRLTERNSKCKKCINYITVSVPSAFFITMSVKRKFLYRSMFKSERNHVHNEKKNESSLTNNNKIEKL